MELEHPTLQLRITGLVGLDHEQTLRRLFPLPLPAIDGREARDDVDAGGEALVHEGATQGGADVRRGRGDEHDARPAHFAGPCVTKPPTPLAASSRRPAAAASRVG